MSDIFIKRHDTKGKFTDTLKLNGNPIDLTLCAVSFILKKTGLVIKQTATILQTAPPPDASAGKVEYQPLPVDVAVKGKYRQEWEVIFPDTEKLTVPNDGWNDVEILEDLDDV